MIGYPQQVSSMKDPTPVRYWRVIAAEISQESNPQRFTRSLPRTRERALPASHSQKRDRAHIATPYPKNFLSLKNLPSPRARLRRHARDKWPPVHRYVWKRVQSVGGVRLAERAHQIPNEALPGLLILLANGFAELVDQGRKLGFLGGNHLRAQNSYSIFQYLI